MAIVTRNLLIACCKSHDEHNLIIHLFLHHFLLHQNLSRLYLKNQTLIVITYVVATNIVLQFVCAITKKDNALLVYVHMQLIIFGGPSLTTNL